MPAQKNQHFVPRCALKPFTVNAEGGAINVLDIPRNRAISNAPVKGQCARAYLYGADLTLESMLGQLEGHYARIVRALSTGRALNNADDDWLRLFAIVQLRRTARAIEDMREFIERMADVVFKDHPEQRPPKDERTDTEMMMLSLRIGFKLKQYVTDLKPVIFRNKTDVEFVISDNPLVTTNRFYFQRLKASNFGLANSGTILAMPLSPRLCVMWYDRGVYTVPNASGTPFVEIKKADDAAAVNEWQYLSAQDNIYFTRWNDRVYVQEQVEKSSARREEAKPRTTTFIRDYAMSGESYRPGTPEEEAAAKETLAMSSQVHPKPSTWPSQIKFRLKPRTFSNDSAVGHVRSAEWLRGWGR
jgi:hypothetical protein